MDGSQDTSTSPTTLPVAPPVPGAPSPATGIWSVPTETAAVLRDLDMACAAVLQKLGENEIDYLSRKTALMEDLRSRRAMFKKLLDDAARKAGLDIDKQHWNFDGRTMTLVRSSN